MRKKIKKTTYFIFIVKKIKISNIAKIILGFDAVGWLTG